MMRTVMGLALVTTLAACNEKKEAAPANTTAPATTTAPTPMPSTTAVVPPAADAAAAPSGEATKPSGAHGGTLKYNPPPAQNPPAKK